MATSDARQNLDCQGCLHNRTVAFATDQAEAYSFQIIETKESVCSGDSSIFVETGAPEVRHLMTFSVSDDGNDLMLLSFSLCSSSEEEEKEQTCEGGDVNKKDVSDENILQQASSMLSYEIQCCDADTGVEVVLTMTLDDNFRSARYQSSAFDNDLLIGGPRHSIQRLDLIQPQNPSEKSHSQQASRYRRPRDSLLEQDCNPCIFSRISQLEYQRPNDSLLDYKKNHQLGIALQYESDLKDIDRASQKKTNRARRDSCMSHGDGNESESTERWQDENFRSRDFSSCTSPTKSNLQPLSELRINGTGRKIVPCIAANVGKVKENNQKQRSSVLRM